MLPYDYARCSPELIGAQCQDCQRWADHPDLTWGPNTPQQAAKSPSHETCHYIPVHQDDYK